MAEIYEYLKPLVEDEAKRLNVEQTPGIDPDPDKLKDDSYRPVRRKGMSTLSMGRPRRPALCGSSCLRA